MRIAFLGTPFDAVPFLRALHGAGHELPLIVTQPDRRRGRGPGLAPSPVRGAAIELGLGAVVRTPIKAREVLDDLLAARPDIALAVAFGQIIPGSLLDALADRWVNVHFSLLPRWRGAAPVERAILGGDAETGVCLMRITEGLDEGPVYACGRTPIDPQETAGELHARLVDLGVAMVLDELHRLPGATPEPQTGQPTYAPKLTVEEFHLEAGRPAEELLRLVRAGNPRPGAWTTVGGRRVKVWRAHVEEDRLVPDEVQPEGKRTMTFAEWRAGHGPGFDLA